MRCIRLVLCDAHAAQFWPLHLTNFHCSANKKKRKVVHIFMEHFYLFLYTYKMNSGEVKTRVIGNSLIIHCVFSNRSIRTQIFIGKRIDLFLFNSNIYLNYLYNFKKNV